MNLETRTFVLEKALSVEKGVNDILQLFLNVEIQKKKAFTNKSGGLSFKNKIDLLFDIEIFDEKEFSTLLLLMEFRNQFMHNYECNNFIDSLTFLGSDKKNRLLQYSKNKQNDTDEENFKDAFNNLHYEILKILLEKIRLKKQSVTDNKEYFDKLNNKIILLYDKYFGLSDLLLELVEPNFSDSKELVDFKINLFNKIDASIQKDIADKNFKDETNERTEEYKMKIIDRHLKTYKKH